MLEEATGIKILKDLLYDSTIIGEITFI